MPLEPKKIVPDFRHGENIHSEREIFFTHNIYKNRRMKCNVKT